MNWVFYYCHIICCFSRFQACHIGLRIYSVIIFEVNLQEPVFFFVIKSLLGARIYCYDYLEMFLVSYVG